MSVAEPEAVQFKLRISPQLKKRIERAAATNGQSVNREAVGRLEDSLNQSEKLGRSGAAIFTQIGEVLVAAASAAGPAWTDNKIAWELIRSTTDRLLRDWEEACDEEELSADGMKAYDDWRASTAIEGRTREEIETEFTELELRASVIGLSGEESERFERLRAALNAKPDFSHLEPRDQVAVKQKIQADKVRAEFWRAVAAMFAGPPGREKFQPKRKKW